MSRSTPARWPSLSSDEWEPTRQTLHRYLQMVGKVRMALVPFRHHWWHTTLQLATRGLTTGPMPYRDGEVEISFDLLDHRLLILTSDGRERRVDLGARPACADFYRDLFDALDELDVRVHIRPVPYDLGEGPAFPEDTVHRSYEADAVTAYWRVLADTGQVLTDFASGFTGEASPVHLFWHLLDLSYTRHPRRPGPLVVGDDGVPRDDTQVVAFGFSPGDQRGIAFPAFYSYAAPEPAQLAEHPLEPVQAQWRDIGSGHRAVLAYDTLRSAADPHRTLLDFYQSAYLAAARAAGWDVAAYSTGVPAARHGVGV
jgi:uncharacterized protein DUF5996